MGTWTLGESSKLPESPRKIWRVCKYGVYCTLPVIPTPLCSLAIDGKHLLSVTSVNYTTRV